MFEIPIRSSSPEDRESRSSAKHQDSHQVTPVESGFEQKQERSKHEPSKSWKVGGAGGPVSPLTAVGGNDPFSSSAPPENPPEQTQRNIFKQGRGKSSGRRRCR